MVGIATLLFTIGSFADSLYTNEDYFRAITEYKRLLFFGDIDSTYGLSQISFCYANSDKYERAAEYLSMDLQRMEDTIPLRSSLRLSWYLLKGGHTYQTRTVLEGINTDLASRMRGISYLAEGKSKEASACFDNKPRIYNEQKMGLFSTILPGCGQLVMGHVIEGLISCTIVGGFGYLSYKALSSKNYYNLGFFSIWLIRFYSGNISRTKEIAREKNRKLRLDLERKIELIENN